MPTITVRHGAARGSAAHGRGLGATLDQGALDSLRRMYRDWPFFRSTVDNARGEMARARCGAIGPLRARSKRGSAPSG